MARQMPQCYTRVLGQDVRRSTANTALLQIHCRNLESHHFLSMSKSGFFFNNQYTVFFLDKVCGPKKGLCVRDTKQKGETLKRARHGCGGQAGCPLA